jgi:hypothetical protein
MPRPQASTFNTTGFTKRGAPDPMGYSLCKTSPFRSDGEAWRGGAKDVTPNPSHPHMGSVLSPERLDKKGKPVKRRKSYLRIACEHWAYDKNSTDCRYGCEARAQVAAFVP